MVKTEQQPRVAKSVRRVRTHSILFKPCMASDGDGYAYMRRPIITFTMTGGKCFGVAGDHSSPPSGDSARGR